MEVLVPYIYNFNFNFRTWKDNILIDSHDCWCFHSLVEIQFWHCPLVLRLPARWQHWISVIRPAWRPSAPTRQRCCSCWERTRVPSPGLICPRTVVSSIKVRPLIHDDVMILKCFRNYSTHWGRDKIAVIIQTAFSNNAFSPMKMFEFQFEFHRNLFWRFQLTINQHWFR